jgi:hypothetical protein
VSEWVERTVHGHRLQIVRQIGHLHLDFGGHLDQQRALHFVGVDQTHFGQRQLAVPAVLFGPLVQVPDGCQDDLQRLFRMQELGKVHAKRLQRSRIRAVRGWPDKKL